MVILLCRYALKVSNFNNLSGITSLYILKRWTKDDKRGILVTCDSLASSRKNEKSIHLSRLSKLMHEGNNVYNIASLTDSGTIIGKDKLQETMKLLELDRETINALECFKNMDEQPGTDFVGNDVPVLNPLIVRT
ncbi:hypothetical protein ACOSP7_009701 [Xanthoceras sorbifolium]